MATRGRAATTQSPAHDVTRMEAMSVEERASSSAGQPPAAATCSSARRHSSWRKLAVSITRNRINMWEGMGGNVGRPQQEQLQQEQREGYEEEQDLMMLHGPNEAGQGHKEEEDAHTDDGAHHLET
ncbi:hypothetical protein EYF80_044252 [Liparis tanakae]|uniref:Uncharacterized protein n=1 Tax=Liparis tanakae TaxID=230148 RepID=A0A4Z2FWC9_9TELE|nr:hypothetical protein EYF80_044252 [Liparis tanakae]